MEIATKLISFVDIGTDFLNKTAGGHKKSQKNLISGLCSHDP
jgi:hypothetical protein